MTRPDSSRYKMEPVYDKHGRLMNGPIPRRGPRAHEPVEMLEALQLRHLRKWWCPVCGRQEERFKEDLPAGFIGISCAGDAVMESVEG